MCFPSKKQKNNFSDNADKSSKPKEPKTEAPVEPTKAEPAVASAESTVPLATSTAPELPPVVAEAPIDMAPPKVGIVIYSMYGHIAKRKFLFLEMITVTCSICSRRLVAEAEKAGIEKAGGQVTIYQ